MLADCLTKVMDSSLLRQVLLNGRYQIYDETNVLKENADKKKALAWFKLAQKGEQDKAKVTSKVTSSFIEKSPA